MASLPSVSDVRLVFQSGPGGGNLAGRWLDAVVAGVAYGASFPAAPEQRQQQRPRRELPCRRTDPECYDSRSYRSTQTG
jgi:hypothetical protein